jgi:hypothetical protein
MRNFTDKFCTENQNTHFMFNDVFPKNVPFMKKRGKIRYDPGRAQLINIIRIMRLARWLTEATDTHSECIILIAFPRQQWLSERASMPAFFTLLII